MTTDALNDTFARPGITFIEGNAGLVKAALVTTTATAEVYLQGANITHFQPAGQPPVLFLSRQSVFRADKAIRGGIPICWPWFGPHPTDSTQPQHGLVRARPWNVRLTQSTPQSAMLSLTTQIENAVATLDVHLDDTLSIQFHAHNTGTTPLSVSEALHTYLSVGDSRHVAIHGLAGCPYIDKVDAGRKHLQDANPITFTGETDRVYMNHNGCSTLIDPIFGRTIRVEASGARSTVIWNPWIEKARALSDFGDDEWQNMCCIESANAGENSYEIAPGQTHTLAVSITARPLTQG